MITEPHHGPSHVARWSRLRFRLEHGRHRWVRHCLTCGAREIHQRRPVDA